MRKPDGSFLYGSDFRYAPMHLANRDKGSLGRTQAGHTALELWGEGPGEKSVREGLERLFLEHRFIEIGRKRQYPHEAWYFTAGYYYYFGHYYAARLIERLADKMWDYDKPYATAFAVMALLRCR
jgi:hypothetical protein